MGPKNDGKQEAIMFYARQCKYINTTVNILVMPILAIVKSSNGLNNGFYPISCTRTNVLEMEKQIFSRNKFFLKVLTMVNCHVCFSGRQTNPFKNDQKSTTENLIMCLPKF